MLNVIGYIFVSLQEFPTRASGLEAQKRQLREYAGSVDVRIKRFFYDDASSGEGGTPPGAGFAKASALGLEKGWPLIVVDLAALAGFGLDHLRFVRDGGKIYDLSGFGEDEVEMRAKIERAMVSGAHRAVTTRAGQARVRAIGVKLGNPRLAAARAASASSRKGESVARHREFGRLVEAAARTGAVTAEQIARWLNDEGYTTPRGSPWKPSNVRRVLKGPTLQEAAVRALGEAMEILAYLDADEMQDLNPGWGDF